MRIFVTARAKLTLSLRVLGGRPDGYHQLEALTVSVASPCDELEFWDRAAPGIGFEAEADSEVEPLSAGEDNLVVQAATRLLELADVGGRGPRGVEARLRKKIPVAAGLGGGSADAAATLLGVRELLSGRDQRVDGRLSDAALGEIAAAIGSDVAFCLVGGVAWMRGRGEEIETLSVPLAEAWPVLVATPAFGLSTAAVYRAWDELGGPTSTRGAPPPAWAAALVDSLENDLEPAAEHLAPGLRPFREALEARVGAPAVLAGSGPSYAVVLGRDREGEIEDLAADVCSALGARAFAGSVELQGVRVERRGEGGPAEGRVGV